MPVIENSAQPQTFIANKGLPLKRLILPVLLLIAGIAIGSGITYYFFPRTIKINYPEVDEAMLPVSLPLLLNPLVYQWRGSVQGKLTDKKEDTFTINDESGNSISITNKMPSEEAFKTVFYKKTKTDWVPTSLKDISIGSVLSGDFFIFKDGKNTPVGGSFVTQ